MAGTVGTQLEGVGQGEALDAAFMCRALELAACGAGHTNPNPLVGAVIERDGRVIGEGWHACYGQEHAERRALADCAARGEDPCGATVYVTLEPCAHHGKQPPCADALVEAGVARVVVGSRDPNPLVAGKGNARLREAGIEVASDVLRDDVRLCWRVGHTADTHASVALPCVACGPLYPGGATTAQHVSESLSKVGE